MVILVTGASHTGKTLLAQRLLEKYRYPCISIDLLKMGLIRSGYTDLTPEDDGKLTEYLWPILRETVKTAVENNQNLILEGVYIPLDWAKDFDAYYRQSIRCICLVMTERYIRAHFDDVRAYASVIENRGADEGLTLEGVLADSSTPILFVVTEAQMPDLHLPMRPVCDFICNTASDAEYAVRIRRLLWPGEETGDDDVVKVDELAVNLATYQVRVDDVPVDLTYMEYSLLAFMVTHPGRAYSRETLLRRVWGFDYCGGSRTVDVHVRRIRAKLGPQASSHIETVRGVGYLFKL